MCPQNSCNLGIKASCLGSILSIRINSAFKSEFNEGHTREALNYYDNQYPYQLKFISTISTENAKS
jgi:hypothetical protein